MNSISKFYLRSFRGRCQYGTSFPLVPTSIPTDYSRFYKGQIPVEIRVKQSEKAMYVTWNDGKVFRYPAEFLRIESPSAEVQGHGPPGYKRLIWGRKFVNIIGVEPQGNYAVCIKFDDLHETGIYPWPYLYYLGLNKIPLMKKYIRELKNAGKSRIPKDWNPSSTK